MSMKRLLAAALAAVAIPAPSLADVAPLLASLIEATGISKRDVQQLGTDPIARELSVPDSSRGISFAAIIRIASDGGGLSTGERVVDPAAWPSLEGAVGSFGEPPTAADMSGLRFSDADVEVLADCEIRECKFKLPRDGIEALETIDWSRADAGQKFTERFRVDAAGYVEEYRKGGNHALVLYADKGSPVPLAKTVEGLIEAFATRRIQAFRDPSSD
jgi:hypothetical protein